MHNLNGKPPILTPDQMTTSELVKTVYNESITLRINKIRPLTHLAKVLEYRANKYDSHLTVCL